MTTTFLNNCQSEGKNRQNGLGSKSSVTEAEIISAQSDKETQVWTEFVANACTYEVEDIFIFLTPSLAYL